MAITITSVSQFAKVLIETKELDPTYDMMYAMREKLGERQTMRFALGMLMYYNLETAYDLSLRSGSEFWKYAVEYYPSFARGKERKHWRGAAGLDQTHALARMGEPEMVFKFMYRPIYTDMVRHVQQRFQGCGMGPYFTWKAMDYFDRVFERPVRLDRETAIRYMHNNPVKQAAKRFPDLSFMQVFNSIFNDVYSLPAPGAPNRMCSWSEAETIACALAPSYKIGSDLARRHKEAPSHLKQFLPPELKETYTCSGHLALTNY